MSALTIGQVAERTGFSTSALRYYEGLGLVTPTTRTEASYRVYDDDAVTRLGFIARAKQLGCSLDEIRDLLGMWDRDRCAPVQRRFHELVTEKIHATQQQIVELIAFASQLQMAAAHLGGPSMDGPCGDDCACLERAGDADATPTPVLLMTSAPSDPPIACTLQPGALPERMADWQAVLASARERCRTADGRLRIEFAGDVDVAELARLATAEQECCTFFSFALTVDGRGIALEVGAPDTATEIASAVFGNAS
jgi:MerR family transcriptional regulator, copper efflux regulator